MRITIHDNLDAMDKRLQALQKLKNTKVKVGLLESAGGQLHFILAVQERGSPPDAYSIPAGDHSGTPATGDPAADG